MGQDVDVYKNPIDNKNNLTIKMFLQMKIKKNPIHQLILMFKN